MLIFIVIVMVMSAGADPIFIVMMMMLMFVRMLLCKRGKVIVERVAVFHRVENVRSGQLIPRRGDYDGVRVVFPDQVKRGVELFLVQILRAAENDAAGCFDLVIEEFAEILVIHLCLFGVDHGDAAAELHIFLQHGPDCRFHVTQFAHARRLDQNMIGMEFHKDLL